MISVDAYPFLAISDLTCYLEDAGLAVFWFHCAAYCKEIEHESSNQEAFPSAGKNTAVVLVSCCAWKCVPTAISDGVDISEAPWVSFVTTNS